MKKHARMLGAMFLVTAALAGSAQPAFAATAQQIRRDASAALNRLYASTPSAKALGAQAKGILIFPGIAKAGFIVGAQGGDGALQKGGKTVAYYAPRRHLCLHLRSEGLDGGHRHPGLEDHEDPSEVGRCTR